MRNIVLKLIANYIKEQSYGRLLFFISAVLFSQLTYAASISESDLKQIAESREWTTIIYYTETDWTLTVQSRSDSPKFFVSKRGKNSAIDELKESLNLLTTEKPPFSDQNFVCRFPARANYLNEVLKLGFQFDRSGCKDYQAWRQRISADRASLVFSSYYLGNPSSSFGHILLRMGKKQLGSETQKELLDQGINFGASPWTENPFLYAVLGMSGAFPGNFIAIPYYYKVREYNDYDSRDLWEYELNLTPAEVSKMTDLLWEQGSNHYDYYFLTENCGYYIVALVEAAAPRYNLTSRLRKWVIPSETLAALAQEGALQKPILRKSIRTQFYEKIETLNSEDQDLVSELFNEMTNAVMQDQTSFSLPKALTAKSELERAKVLDAAIDYYDFRYSKKVILGEEPYIKVKRSLLIARAELPTYDLSPKTTLSENSPDKSHGSGRVELGYSEAKSNDYNEHSLLLGYRFAFHDYLDHQQGAPQRAHIEIFKIQGAIENEDLKLLNFSPFDIRSSPLWNRWDRDISWKVRLALEESPYQTCSSCLATNLNLGVGLTTGLSKLDVSLMADVNGLYANDYDRALQALVGPSLIIKSIPFKRSWGWLLEGKYFPNEINEFQNLYSISANVRYHFEKNLNVDFGYVQEKDREIFKINFLIYHY
ncbi:Lnb N-terminal periplasmic domain-containing protein [Bdellovibrio reynosensis]|uniref:DUF4105 domain-containing protein n=1 Tax=Bdellovibrio reynosensis TaxID=2835041 RepID=A0ABY4C9N3_9BACT|nr:DUF4105 domain-containing protein [Bdellovibrio reynosensis]UOF00617.1 DUF4105 domain-containing protein [Bdellovibrio reynosensis]